MDWDRDEEDDEKQKEPNLSPVEQLMTAILEEKKKDTIMMLLSKLTRRNRDIEESLNSQTVLVELSENESTFPLLISGMNLEYLIE